MHHFDFYRLSEGGMVARELAEVLEDDKAIVVVEWGDAIEQVLPIDHIKVELQRQAGDENARKVNISYSSKFKHVFEGIK